MYKMYLYEPWKLKNSKTFQANSSVLNATFHQKANIRFQNDNSVDNVRASEDLEPVFILLKVVFEQQ